MYYTDFRPSERQREARVCQAAPEPYMPGYYVHGQRCWPPGTVVELSGGVIFLFACGRPEPARGRQTRSSSAIELGLPRWSDTRAKGHLVALIKWALQGSCRW